FFGVGAALPTGNDLKFIFEVHPAGFAALDLAARCLGDGTGPQECDGMEWNLVFIRHGRENRGKYGFVVEGPHLRPLELLSHHYAHLPFSIQGEGSPGAWSEALVA